MPGFHRALSLHFQDCPESSVWVSGCFFQHFCFSSLLSPSPSVLEDKASFPLALMLQLCAAGPDPPFKFTRLHLSSWFKSSSFPGSFLACLHICSNCPYLFVYMCICVLEYVYVSVFAHVHTRRPEHNARCSSGATYLFETTFSLAWDWTSMLCCWLAGKS